MTRGERKAKNDGGRSFERVYSLAPMQSTRDSVASKRDWRGGKPNLTMPRASGKDYWPSLQVFEIRFMNKQEPSTYRPFVFTVIEDHGVNVTIEVSEDDYPRPISQPELMKRPRSNRAVTS